jgi:hypothetical protein
MPRLPYYYEKEQQEKENSKEAVKDVAQFGLVAGLFALAWMLAGLAAFVMSIVCFGRSGSMGQHIAGLLLAAFFGPFYWIFYGVSPDYCNKISTVGIPGFGGKRGRR